MTCLFSLSFFLLISNVCSVSLPCLPLPLHLPSTVCLSYLKMVILMPYIYVPDVVFYKHVRDDETECYKKDWHCCHFSMMK